MKRPSRASDAVPNLFSDCSPPSPSTVCESLPPTWQAALSGEFCQPYFHQLQQFLAKERDQHLVLPDSEHVFAAYHATPLDQVKVVLLGQDPYPTPGHAHGLCFSVRPGVTLPASLRNIYKELESDLGIPPTRHGYLRHWAEQGMLMLNAVLTVRSGEPNSHANHGWEQFTDATIRAVNALSTPVIFILWGAYAQKKRKLLTESKHHVLASAHPSPLSARNGFFGSKPFSKIQEQLRLYGYKEFDWRLPDVVVER